jgi:cell division septation protein DedD
MERVLEIIRRDAGAERVQIDTPTQNLESYFLGVVEQAKQTEETSGATSGHRVAAYLRGEADAPSHAERVLERLTLPQAAPAPPVAVQAPEPAVDTAKLEALSHRPEPAPTPKPETPPPADLERANQKLAALLGGKGGGQQAK